MVAIKGLRDGQSFAKRMEEVGVARHWGAPRVLKEKQITALVMAVVGDVPMKAVTKLLEDGQACAFDMEVASAARLKAALKVLRDTQVFVSLMEAVAGLSFSFTGIEVCDWFVNSFVFLKAIQWDAVSLIIGCDDLTAGCRCQFPACTKGAQGSTMFCKAHGGGKRCIIAGCNKGAEGSTPLCKGHGGGKRCAFDGGGICTKSVHGGTLYCVAHGGGKRCAVEGCAKSARGRTDFCVRHGGGKRCKVGCGKSAQGSTDFCKAHGGGKRCQWGVEGSAFSNMSINANGTTGSTTLCDKFARGKSGLCVAHSALVQDMRVHGGSVTAGPFTPGLAPGLFRGLVSGSGQSRLGTNTSFSSGVTTAVASGSRPAGSGSDLDTSSGLVGMSHVSSMLPCSFGCHDLQILVFVSLHGVVSWHVEWCV